MANTAFKQVKNNVYTFLASGQLNNTTNPLTLTLLAAEVAKFPVPGNGSYVTAWNASNYSNPGDDPNMRIGLITAVANGSPNGTVTITWGQFGTPIIAVPGALTLALLVVDQLFVDIHGAVNTLETNLAAEIVRATAIESLKALDSSVVHNTGTETIAGVKSFSSAPVVPVNSFPESAVGNLTTDLAAKALDAAVVHLTGNETVAGVKTFSLSPIVPSNSFPESAVTNLIADLAATEKTANKGMANGYAGLDSGGKVPTAQLPSSVLGALEYQGTYDASGGSFPSSPSKGYYYVISVAGTLGGISYKIGDWLTYDGTGWDKIDNQQTVSSVAGRIGAITLGESDIANLVADLSARLIGANNLGDVANPATAFSNIKQSATAGATGVIQLAGDLGGVGSTAALPVLKGVGKVFNVLDYGAVGDGTIIDLTSINNAITDANTAGGGTVLLPVTPSLTYLVNGLVIIKSNVILMAASRAVTIKLAAASNTGVISNGNVSTSNAVIKNLTVDANAANQTSNGSVGAAAVYFGTVGGSNTLINVGCEDVTVKNTYKHGIFITGDSTSYTEKFVRRCLVINHGPTAIGFGIYCDFAPGTVLEVNTVQVSNGNDAIEIGHQGAKCTGNDLLDGPLQFPFGDNSVITYNIVRNNTIQNDANTANNVIIANNQVLNAAPTSGFAGISLTGANPMIIGNNVKVSAQSGIRTFQGDGGTVAGNTVNGTNPSTGGTNGIYSNTSNRVKIYGNDISNFATAIEVTHDDNVAYGNTANNCTTGIDLSDSSSSGHVISMFTAYGNDLSGATTTFNAHNQTNYNFMQPSGKNIGLGVTAPTAHLHLKAGTVSAGSAPLKIDSGTNLTTPEDGAVEYNGTHFYATIGATRYQLDQQTSSGAVTSITGTANQVIASASTGAVTLSLPQSINTAATPTFGGMTLSASVSGSPLTALTLKNTAGAASSDITISMTPGNLTTGSAQIRAQAPGSSNTRLAFYTSHANATAVMQLFIDDVGNLNPTDGINFILGSTTGMKFGTATTQKLAFFNSAPIVQPAGDVITALQNLGLVASATISESDITNLSADLAAKAPLASPTFTGTVTVPTPVNATDAVTKSYVDNVAQGLTAKPSAVAATTGSETFTIVAGSVTQISGTTIDGISPAVNDRILVKNAPASTGTGLVNSTQPGNGIYVVTANTTNLSLSRANDMDDANDLPAGAFVFVEAGAANSSSGYVVGAPNSGAAFTYGTDSIAWVQFSGAGEISAGSGLSKAGNTLSVATGGITNAMLVGTDIATVGTITAGTWNATIITSAYGGTGNGFTKFSGPVTSEKTFTLPNASATILTDNAAVTVAQGGTGQTTYTDGQLLIGNSSSNSLNKATITGTANRVTVTNGNGTITLTAPQDLATTSAVTFAQVNVNGASSGGDLSVLTFKNTAGAANSNTVMTMTPGNLTTGSAQIHAHAPGSSNTHLSFWTSTANAAATEKVRLDNAGNLGIGTTSPTNILSLGGQSAQIFWMERETTSNTAGNSLTVESGGATSAATDKGAGDLVLRPGLSTGQGGANVRIQTMTRALSSGTGDNAAVDRIIAQSPKSVTNNSATTVASMTLASASIVAGQLHYVVEVTDNTDYQYESGTIAYGVTNKAGTIANNVVTKFGNQQAATSGTLTVTFTITAGNPALIQLNANSSLTPSAGYPRVTFILENLSQQAVAIS